MSNNVASFHIRAEFEYVMYSDEQAAAFQRAFDWFEKYGEKNEELERDLPQVVGEPVKVKTVTIHTGLCDELSCDIRDFVQSVDEALPGYLIVDLRKPSGDWTTTDYLTKEGDIDAIEQTFRARFGDDVPIVRCACVAPKSTALDEPTRRDDEGRGIVACWNIGLVDGRGGQRQVRMAVTYFKGSGYVATLATVVETVHEYGTSWDYQDSMNHLYRVHVVPAARFGKAALEKAYTGALAELRAQFERGEPEVVRRFDEMTAMSEA